MASFKVGVRYFQIAVPFLERERESLSRGGELFNLVADQTLLVLDARALVLQVETATLEDAFRALASHLDQVCELGVEHFLARTSSGASTSEVASEAARRGDSERARGVVSVRVSKCRFRPGVRVGGVILRGVGR